MPQIYTLVCRMTMGVWGTGQVVWFDSGSRGITATIEILKTGLYTRVKIKIGWVGRRIQTRNK